MIRGDYLIGDHKKYIDENEELIFGHEGRNDVRSICSYHNRKGVRSDSVIFICRLRWLAWWLVVWIPSLPFVWSYHLIFGDI